MDVDLEFAWGFGLGFYWFKGEGFCTLVLPFVLIHVARKRRCTRHG